MLLEQVLERLHSGEHQPPEAAMPTNIQEEYRQLQRSLTVKMLDRAASEPTWKQQLLDEPEAAMVEASFAELDRLDYMEVKIELARPCCCFRQPL